MTRKKSNKGKRDKVSHVGTSKKGATVISPPRDQVGLLITAELDKALVDCKAKVERIARNCRAGNRNFRDLEFDLESDTRLCLYGLSPEDPFPTLPDVRRVTEIYDNPRFFIDGASSGDIEQGELGDCWFLSALATLSNAKGLIEQCCVARDEQVGIYGFIFFRHNAWESVIIDDQLFWSLPKYEELSGDKQKLWHNDKALYNDIARKRGKGLLFARTSTEGETWVPLIEKAYAKLHGDFAALDGGFHNEAVEDMTGGVSLLIRMGDILDPEKFWHEELIHAGNHCLFGLSLPDMVTSSTVNGLITGHAYSVIRAQECRGKKFVIIRNPWGKSEWTGPWSDGAKEWNGESLSMLSELGHIFGDDGQFVMEYSDFLSTWDLIERTTIFDSSWIMASHWISARAPPDLHPWTFGDISFDFTLAEPSEVIIVLSQMNDRFFKGISGWSVWQLEFVLHKRGETDHLASSSYGMLEGRSVMCERALDAGEYVVFVRLDRVIDDDETDHKEGFEEWDRRKLSRVLSQRVECRSIASNFDLTFHKQHIPLSVEEAIKKDWEKLSKVDETAEEENTTAEAETTATVVAATKVVKTTIKSKSKSKVPRKKNRASYASFSDLESGSDNDAPDPRYDFMDNDEVEGDDDLLFLGLRVYTKKHAPVTVTGHVTGNFQ